MFRKFIPTEAPKYYVFVDPDTGFKYEANSFRELIARITNYRKANELPQLHDLPAVVENYLCSQPENAGKCRAVELRRGVLPTLRGGIAVLENLFFGASKMTPPGEAARRAAVCTGCPFNVFPDKSGFIKWSDEIAEAATLGKAQTLPKEMYDSLGNCEVCSCPLRAKVWYKGPFDLTSEQQSTVPTYCWQLENVTG